jgi:hypothetical protein
MRFSTSVQDADASSKPQNAKKFLKPYKNFVDIISVPFAIWRYPGVVGFGGSFF